MVWFSYHTMVWFSMVWYGMVWYGHGHGIDPKTEPAGAGAEEQREGGGGERGTCEPQE